MRVAPPREVWVEDGPTVAVPEGHGNLEVAFQAAAYRVAGQGSQQLAAFFP